MASRATAKDKEAAATAAEPKPPANPRRSAPLARGDGWRVIVKLNLPPEKQYHSGHSLMVQGDTVAEVQEHLAYLIEDPEAGSEPTENTRDQARFILLRFIEFAQQGAVSAALTSGAGGEEVARESGQATSGASPDLSPDTSATEVVQEAAAAATAATPPGQRPASDTLKAFAAKKLGTEPSEYDGKTEDEVKALLK